MPKLLSALLAFASLAATAQQQTTQPTPPPAGSNWQHVQALPAGTEVYLNAKSRHIVCTIKSTTADALTCTERAKDDIVARSEISSIKITRSGRSTLIGLGVGTGTGAVLGAVGCRGDWQGGCAKVFGLILGLAGTVIGYTTDFSRSTVYKAP
jgi:hypothetical protein